MESDTLSYAALCVHAYASVVAWSIDALSLASSNHRLCLLSWEETEQSASTLRSNVLLPFFSQSSRSLAWPLIVLA